MPLAVGRAVVTRRAAQRSSTSAKRLESWRQLVPLRALLDSPTNTTGVFFKAGLFFEAGLFFVEGVVGRRGGRRRPVPGLVGEQFPAAALYGSEGGQGRGRGDGVGCGCHDTTLVRFRIERQGLTCFLQDQ